MRSDNTLSPSKSKFGFLENSGNRKKSQPKGSSEVHLDAEGVSKQMRNAREQELELKGKTKPKKNAEASPIETNLRSLVENDRYRNPNASIGRLLKDCEHMGRARRQAAAGSREALREALQQVYKTYLIDFGAGKLDELAEKLDLKKGKAREPYSATAKLSEVILKRKPKRAYDDAAVICLALHHDVDSDGFPEFVKERGYTNAVLEYRELQDADRREKGSQRSRKRPKAKLKINGTPEFQSEMRKCLQDFLSDNCKKKTKHKFTILAETDPKAGTISIVSTRLRPKKGKRTTSKTN